MTQMGRFYGWAMEIGWLVAIAAAPLYFNFSSAQIFEPDKATILRCVVLLIAAAFILETLELRRSGTNTGGDGAEAGQWRSPLMQAALALAGVQILATITSIVPWMSWWGSYARLEGTYTFLAYLTLFLIMMARLNRREQVDRVITVALLVSVPVSVYAVAQFLHLDPLPWGGDVTARVSSSQGNAIFLAAYLIMVVPLTLLRWVDSFRHFREERDAPALRLRGPIVVLLGRAALVLAMNVPLAFIVAQTRGAPGIWWGALPALLSFVLLCLPFTSGQGKRLPGVFTLSAYTVLLLGQLAAIFFSQSRGPWIGLAAGIAFFLVMLGVRSRNWRLLKTALVMAIPAALLLIVFNLPVAQLSSLRQVPYLGRLGTLADIESGTGKVRALIWQSSLELIRDRPSPGLQPDRLRPLRLLLGYGPEAMGPASHKVYQPSMGHIEAGNIYADRNHMDLLDHMVMTGVLGLLAYLILVVIVFRLAWVSLWKHDHPYGQLVLVGVGSALVAHFVESQVGIVVVATSTYFWLCAVVIGRAPVWMKQMTVELAAGNTLAPSRTVAAGAAVDTAAGGAHERGRRPEFRRLLTWAAGLARDGARSSAWPPWYWLGGYAGLSGLAVVLLVGAGPIDDARTSLALSYAWAVVGVMAGALYMLRVSSVPLGFGLGSLASSLPGSWTRLVPPVMALVVVGWFSLFNLDVVAADIYFKRALQMDRAGQPDDALLRYQYALRLQPQQDEYYFFFGRALLSVAVKKSSEQAPSTREGASASLQQLFAADVPSLVGMTRDELLAATDLVFKEACRLDPFDADHFVALGQLHRYWGESVDASHLDQAVEYLEQAVAVSPRRPSIRSELARAHTSKGNLGQAIQVLESAKQVDPLYTTAYVLLGNAYEDMQMWDRALANHVTAMLLDPSSFAGSGAEERLTRYVTAGKGDLLTEAARQIMERYPDNSAAHSTYAFVLFRQGRMEEALAQFQANVDLSPEDWVGYRNIAISYQQLGMVNEALDSAQLALRYAPESQRKPIRDFIASLQPNGTSTN